MDPIGLKSITSDHSVLGHCNWVTRVCMNNQAKKKIYVCLPAEKKIRVGRSEITFFLNFIFYN